MNIKNLLIRACTGAVYVLLLVGCVVYSPVSAYFFFAVVAAASLVEFGTIVNKHAHASLPVAINAMAGFMLVSAMWLYCIGGTGVGKMLSAYGLLLLYLLISELYRQAENPLRNWSMAFASHIYIAMPMALLPLLSISSDAVTGQPVYQWIYVISLFVFLWCNDTGAYLTGCTLSRYFPAKLFPRISPKKSWVGSIGGALLTLLVSVLISSFLPQSMPLWRWMGFALVVVVFGTWGDLVESMLKRQLNIKDSGNILPGHGGLLDRFDSALLSIPAVVIYMCLTENI